MCSSRTSSTLPPDSYGFGAGWARKAAGERECPSPNRNSRVARFVAVAGHRHASAGIQKSQARWSSSPSISGTGAQPLNYLAVPKKRASGGSFN
jgi:hypothetical protein